MGAKIAPEFEGNLYFMTLPIIGKRMEHEPERKEQQKEEN
jgi:hypothetical protein